MISEPSGIIGGKGDYLIIHKRMGDEEQIPPIKAFFEVNGLEERLLMVFENSDFLIYRIAKNL